MRLNKPFYKKTKFFKK